MAHYDAWWRRLLRFVGIEKRGGGLVLTQIREDGLGDTLFRVFYNGYDYEVHVFNGKSLVYQNTGFATIEDAEQFVYFYKKNLYVVQSRMYSE